MCVYDLKLVCHSDLKLAFLLLTMCEMSAFSRQSD